MKMSLTVLPLYNFHWMRVLLATLLLYACGCHQRPPPRPNGELPDDHLFTDQAEAVKQADLAALRQSHPALAADFQRARELSDQGRYQESLAAAQRVHQGAPEFAPALRRMCYSADGLGREHREQALGYCRDALRLAPNARNRTALASVLTGDNPGVASSDEFQEAKQLLQQASEEDPTGLYEPQVQCTLAFHMVARANAAGPPLLDLCTARMLRGAPRSVIALYSATINAAVHEKLSDAHGYVDQLEQLGASPTLTSSLRTSIEQSRSPAERALRWAAKILVPWALGMLALLAIGSLLSRMTLRYAGKPVNHEAPTRTETTLLKSYRTLLTVASAYYYLSLPIVLLIVAAVVGLLFLLVLWIGIIPVKLVVILGLVVFGSVAAVLKSFWAKTIEIPPGTLIDITNHPVLSQMLDELEQKLQTKRPTKIYLTTGVDAAVYEEGGVWAHLRGKSTRCLVLGLALVEGLTMDELRSILAHEYGHFRNKDTAGGHLALSVRRSMFRTVNSLAEQGVGSLSPLWWFAVGYYKLFMRISQGASRLQEILADRVAAKCYGSNTFASALRATTRHANLFDLTVKSVLDDAFAGKYAISNLYAQAKSATVDDDKVEALTLTELGQEPSVYDSHPSGLQRIAMVNALGFASENSDTTSAMGVFANAAELQQQMTKTVLDRIEARTGKNLSELQPAPESEEGVSNPAA